MNIQDVDATYFLHPYIIWWWPTRVRSVGSDVGDGGSVEQLLCDCIPECKVDEGYHRGCGSGGVGSVSIYNCS